MSTSDQSFARDFLCETLAIPAGTNATLSPVPGQIAVQLKYLAGGSLALVGSTFAVSGVVYGSTFAINNNYIFGTSEILRFDAKGVIVLAATGVTTTVGVIRSLSSPKSLL